MDPLLIALADPARWRLVSLLAERPRSVGVLAQLAKARQPQTTKHLQTLARVGLVAVFPLGQRRVYAVEAPALRALAQRLGGLAAAAEQHAGDRDVIARYLAAIEAETARAKGPGWADGRTFAFDRDLPASPEVVWQQWVDPALLATWWVPPTFTVTRCALTARRGGRALLEYRDADGHSYLSRGHVHTATKPEHLAFDLSVLDDQGSATFTGRYDVTLAPAPEGTRLHLDLTLTDTTVGAVSAIAGIEPGWGQVLDHLTDVLTKGHSS